MSQTQTEVKDAPDAGRFEAVVDGDVAGFAEYRRHGQTVVFTHTKVDDSHEGKGVGSSLVRGALDAVRVEGGQVVPRCEFVRSYIERHPEYADLVVDDPA